MKRRRPRSKHTQEFISLRKTILLLLLASLLLFGYVWTRLQKVKLSYKYSKLSIQEQTLSEKNHKLRLELAALKNPARLTNIAKKKMGLKPTPAKNKIFIQISKEEKSNEKKNL